MHAYVTGLVSYMEAQHKPQLAHGSANKKPTGVHRNRAGVYRNKPHPVTYPPKIEVSQDKNDTNSNVDDDASDNMLPGVPVLTQLTNNGSENKSDNKDTEFEDLLLGETRELPRGRGHRKRTQPTCNTVEFHKEERPQQSCPDKCMSSRYMVWSHQYMR